MTMFWKILVIGFCAIMVLIGYACCVVAGRADEQSERFYQELEQKNKDE